MSKVIWHVTTSVSYDLGTQAARDDRNRGIYGGTAQGNSVLAIGASTPRQCLEQDVSQGGQVATLRFRVPPAA